MSIMEKARKYLEQVKAVEGDREAVKKLYEALPKPVQKEAQRIRKASYFTPENAKLDERREHVSPSGAYKLVVTPFATKPGSWSYSQGLVYRGDELIAEVQRNYDSFPFAWVEGHSKGDFFLCGEDYQGQTVVNLKTGARRDHLPAAAEKGFGFCWASIHPNASGTLLAVEGCIWGGPYEVRFYDFSEPMLPPWTELSGNGDPEEFFEWLDDDRVRVGRTEEVYVPLNKTADELYAAHQRGEMTREEFDRCGDDEANWTERENHERQWVRPTPLEALTGYTNDTLPIRKKNGYEVSRDILQNVRALIERLSEAEMSMFEGSETKALVDWAFANQEAA